MTFDTDYESFSWKVDREKGITKIIPKKANIEKIVEELARAAIRTHFPEHDEDVMYQRLVGMGRIKNTNLNDDDTAIEFEGAKLRVGYSKGNLRLVIARYDDGHKGTTHEDLLAHAARNLMIKNEINLCKPMNDNDLADLFGEKAEED